MAELKDSGARRDFGTGAVRDVADGKGRCDLLPLGVVAHLLTGKRNEGPEDMILNAIDQYVRYGTLNALYHAIEMFSERTIKSVCTSVLEVSHQYEDGAAKYNDRNWEKGIPLHCFIDSGVRHYLKFLRGDTDEPHDRAFLWNLLGAIWTHENRPEMIDLPFAEKAHQTPLNITMPRHHGEAEMKRLFKAVERLIDKEVTHNA